MGGLKVSAVANNLMGVQIQDRLPDKRDYTKARKGSLSSLVIGKSGIITNHQAAIATVEACSGSREVSH